MEYREINNGAMQPPTTITEGKSNLLKERREKLGYDIKTAAFKCRISLTTYKRLESGNRDMGKISLETAVKIARGLKCRAEDLMGDMKALTDEEYQTIIDKENEKKLNLLKVQDPAKYEKYMADMEAKRKRSEERARKNEVRKQIKLQKKRAKEVTDKIKALQEELKAIS